MNRATINPARPPRFLPIFGQSSGDDSNQDSVVNAADDFRTGQCQQRDDQIGPQGGPSSLAALKSISGRGKHAV